MPLTPALSAYLDALRFVAALCVLIGHLAQDGFNLSWLPLAQLSHEAVMVFFVMSGYIVTSTTLARPERRALDYVIARASRIYSVAVPAIVFCVVIGAALGTWAPEIAARIDSWRPWSWADVLGSLLFWHEALGVHTDLTLNGPYWSLCYEVWYYLLFGLFIFVRGPWRWPLLVLACGLAGPAVLALLPIWLLGAWLATRSMPLPQIGPSAACVAWLLSMALIVGLGSTGLDIGVKDWLHQRVPGFWRLEGSQRLVTDYVIGALLVAHLWAYTQLPSTLQAGFARQAPRLAAWAGFSFTLYLFHRPMTLLAAAFFEPLTHSAWASLAVAALLVLLCWLIAFTTERQLPRWRRGLRRLAS